MNLVSDPWVPVLDAKNRTRLVGLEELFQNSIMLADLALKPLERVAVTRLLICITQAALDGPSDHADWKTCRDKIVPVSLAYLGKWKHRFELYGPEPFLQVTTLATNPNVSTIENRLNHGASSGLSNLFDKSDASKRVLDPAWVALRLLTHQSFALGGLAKGPTWNGQPTNPSPKAAPCAERSMLLALLRGGTLLDTIYLNLIPRSDLEGFTWGRPVWEQYPVGPRTHSGSPYLGRLVPLSRALWLYPDVDRLEYACGINYAQLPAGREPMATVKWLKKKPAGSDTNLCYVRNDPQRHPWRELGSLLALSASNGSGGPLSLRKFHGQTEGFDLWVGGLVGDQSKLLNIVEWNCYLPPGILNAGALYASGVQAAEDARQQIYFAVSTYAKSLNVKADGLLRQALTYYWTVLDGRSGELSRLAASPAIKSLDPWKQIVQDAAHEAFKRACPRNDARRLLAFTLGARKLK